MCKKEECKNQVTCSICDKALYYCDGGSVRKLEGHYIYNDENYCTDCWEEYRGKPKKEQEKARTTEAEETS